MVKRDESSMDIGDPEPESSRYLESPFELQCLRPENKNILDKSINRYFQCNLHNQTKNIGNKGHLSKDFIPWWVEFSKPTPKQCSEQKTSSNSEPDRYLSWFTRTGSDANKWHLFEGNDWLAGPSISELNSSKPPRPKVEDIPVPSIYEQKLSMKGKRALKRERKAEREKTLGKKWYGMKAPDKDDPVRKDMELIQMRGVLDPKRFYKNHDRKAVPKYFQMGTVMDEGTDFYASRLTRKQRKHTLVEELMADADVRKYNKKKYAELQSKMRGKKKQKEKSKKTK